MVGGGLDLVVYQNTTPKYLVVTFFECNAIDVLIPAVTELPLYMKVGATETLMRCSELCGSWGNPGSGPYLAGNVFGMVFPPGSKMIIRNTLSDPVQVSYHVTGYFRGP